MSRAGTPNLKNRLSFDTRKIGEWTVLDWYCTTKHAKCVCSCGTEKLVIRANLTRQMTISCGCKQYLFRKQFKRERRAWSLMKYRCHSPTSSDYPKYGGRGIEVCQRWRESLASFLEDMGPAPSAKHTVDRIDNFKGYEPGNCRWATNKQQMRNRRCGRFLTSQGETKCLAEWAEITGLSAQVISGRLERGWSLDRALTQKVGGKCQ